MTWGIDAVAGVLRELELDVTDVGPDSLRVRVDGGEQEVRTARLQLVASPSQPAQLLRFEVTYPFRAPDVDDARLAGAMLMPHLVLGHTEVEDDGSLHHRYAMVVDITGDVPAGPLHHALAALDYEQVHFGDYLEVLCEEKPPVRLFAKLVEQGEAAAP